ncbi:hypothetical protein HYPSUDRAFT_42305 [Hypholoma sublateritium FD-334 SS-4]|uniref:Uncharacterized protein n=1 Tax=Hypholoma sublateritium (strain FD-334 SS-4) TaxID=945553 RepID=A0A0D2NXK6_HYPSF|nr:hypothetical protein HYPSUDRAFT_42305 [Hypholoma sublateritium FD-334 SS-4]
MERLCDEVLQLIFYELADPSPLTQVSKHFHRFSQDPYVRAHYFLVHYGSTEAVYRALGRGKLVTARVLDILLTSGAHLSRYLIQIAIHHYFHTQTHFIKTPWVRSVPLRVFAYFLTLAEEKYGEIPRGKGEDDGSLFTTFLKESRLPSLMKSVSWETIKTLLETYHFIPFSNKDPIMSQFPLALAIEPRLLPSAIANGFSMDYKYRDFVFRKMFERPAVSSETRADDIAGNIRELCKLDPAMFVSRTVAAEVCMEAKANEVGYAALKQLDKAGDLRFELSSLVEELLATFLTTRSISNVSTGDIILHLFADFPSTDTTVRLVVLVVAFISADNLHTTLAAMRAKIETLGVGPITRRDIVNVLVNPFVERYHSVIEFARQEVKNTSDDRTLSGSQYVDDIVEEVAAKCLEIACKGKLLKSLAEGFPCLKQMIAKLTLARYQIAVGDLPSWEHELNSPTYSARLCRDFMRHGVGEVHTKESLLPESVKSEEPALEQPESRKYAVDAAVLRREKGTDQQRNEILSDLGDISQESLTTMIRQDEVTPIRSRRRILYSFGPSDVLGKCRYPHDPVHIGKWIRASFGPRSSVTAIFMTHAVINDNCTMLHHYLMHNDPGSHNGLSAAHVPVTFKHFQLLARLGRTPNFYIWQDIELGAEFYFDENDYLTDNNKVKIEPTQSTLSASPTLNSPNSTSRGRKRPRRTAKETVRSYVVPDSDEDLATSDQDENEPCEETNLQLWIKHLSILLKAETRKYTLMKRNLEKTPSENKVRIQKNDFIKSLTTNLRTLRKVEAEKHQHTRGVVEDYSDDQDDDYVSKDTKRRKLFII